MPGTGPHEARTGCPRRPVLLALVGALALAGVSRGSTTGPPHVQRPRRRSRPSRLRRSSSARRPRAAGSRRAGHVDGLADRLRVPVAAVQPGLLADRRRDRLAPTRSPPPTSAATIKVTVTASNADGATRPTPRPPRPSTRAPAGAPRKLRPRPRSPGPPGRVQALSATSGSWSGSGNTYAYRGSAATRAAARAREIAGATRDDVHPAGTTSARRSARGDGDERVGIERRASPSDRRRSPPAPAPSNTKAPSISGTPKDNHKVKADPGTWTGDSPISYGYQWQRCDSHGATARNWAARPRKYEVRSTDEGSHAPRRRHRDEQRSARARRSSGPVTVQGRTQAAGASPDPRSPEAPAVGQTLTASRGGWSGSDPARLLLLLAALRRERQPLLDHRRRGGSTYRPVRRRRRSPAAGDVRRAEPAGTREQDVRRRPASSGDRRR